jgi:hypothetical protein
VSRVSDVAIRASSQGVDEKEHLGLRAKIIASLWILLGLSLIGAFGAHCQALVRQSFLGSS